MNRVQFTINGMKIYFNSRRTAELFCVVYQTLNRYVASIIWELRHLDWHNGRSVLASPFLLFLVLLSSAAFVLYILLYSIFSLFSLTLFFIIQVISTCRKRNVNGQYVSSKRTSASVTRHCFFTLLPGGLQVHVE